MSPERLFEMWMLWTLSLLGIRMGYRPAPPPPLPLQPNGTKPAISPADDATFDQWICLPPEDHRTLDEYAENPVELTRRLPIRPPPPPNIRTGTMKASWSGINAYGLTAEEAAAKLVFQVGRPIEMHREDRYITRNELPPVYPDEEDS